MAEDEWFDPAATAGVWEHQGHPLTLRELLDGLLQTSPRLARVEQVRLVDQVIAATGDLPIKIEHYDGRDRRVMHPMHLDVLGADGEMTALLFTIH